MSLQVMCALVYFANVFPKHLCDNEFFENLDMDFKQYEESGLDQAVLPARDVMKKNYEVLIVDNRYMRTCHTMLGQTPLYDAR